MLYERNSFQWKHLSFFSCYHIGMSAGACIPWHPYGCQRTTFAVCFLLILMGWAFLLVLLLFSHELDFELKDIFPVQSSHLCLRMLELQMCATVLHFHQDLLFVICFSPFNVRANNLASAWGKINFCFIDLSWKCTVHVMSKP